MDHKEGFGIREYPLHCVPSTTAILAVERLYLDFERRVMDDMSLESSRTRRDFWTV